MKELKNLIYSNSKDELDKLAYVELIKKTIENMTYLPKKINENIFRSIYYEDDLDKLAGYYKLRKLNLVMIVT
nr:hypothetical protein [Mycoplasmopsis bovis]